MGVIMFCVLAWVLVAWVALYCKTAMSCTIYDLCFTSKERLQRILKISQHWPQENRM